MYVHVHACMFVYECVWVCAVTQCSYAVFWENPFIFIHMYMHTYMCIFESVVTRMCVSCVLGELFVCTGLNLCKKQNFRDFSVAKVFS